MLAQVTGGRALGKRQAGYGSSAAVEGGSHSMTAGGTVLFIFQSEPSSLIQVEEEEAREADAVDVDSRHRDLLDLPEGMERTEAMEHLE